MKEKLKQLISIQSMMALVSFVLLSILTIQTSAIAQNTAPVPQTGQTQSYAAGDDGDLQMGVQWPDPRFTDNGDGTVTDNLTELIWLKNADCFGSKDWLGALNASNNLADGQCGLSDGSILGDWRLSNVRELLSLIDYDNFEPPLPPGYPFTNVRTGGEPASSYWSSTTVADRTVAACLVILEPLGSLMDDAPKSEDTRGVWPVRGGNEVGFVAASVPQTGQTQSYAAGDDGDLQIGVQWPDPRFTDNGDGTVTDNLTELIWLKNADCFGSKDWLGALNASNNLADGQCGLSDGSILGDWRLSNVRELRSLIDHGQFEPPLPSGNPFINVPLDDYWSSTTVPDFTDDAWIVLIGSGGDIGFTFGQVRNEPKDSFYRVWPVRDEYQVLIDGDGGGGT